MRRVFYLVYLILAVLAFCVLFFFSYNPSQNHSQLPIASLQKFRDSPVDIVSLQKFSDSPVEDDIVSLQKFRDSPVEDKNPMAVPAIVAALMDPTPTSLKAYYILWSKTKRNKKDGFRAIPRIVHQTGSLEMLRSAEFLSRQKEWQELNPNYFLKTYSDNDCDIFVKQYFPDLHKIYSSFIKIVMKSDMFRYLIILAKGGVYSDVDTRCLKPIEQWGDGLDASLIVGIETDIQNSRPNVDRNKWWKWWVRQIQFVQWTFAAEAGHPVLVEVIWRIIQKTKAWENAVSSFKSANAWQLEEGMPDLMSVFENSKSTNNRPPPHNELFSLLSFNDLILDWTGPGLWTDSVVNYLQNMYQTSFERFQNAQKNIAFPEGESQTTDIVILTIAGFSPGHNALPLSMNNALAYVKHDFKGSWRQRKRKGTL